MIMAGGGLAIAAALGVWFWQAGSASSTEDVNAAVLAAGINAKEQKAIEAIVRDYILNNPEIIPEAVEILQNRQKSSAIDAVRAQIEQPFAGNAFAGNPDGDVVVVEYSDFNCPYCKQTERDIARVIAEDKRGQQRRRVDGAGCCQTGQILCLPQNHVRHRSPDAIDDPGCRERGRSRYGCCASLYRIAGSEAGNPE